MPENLYTPLHERPAYILHYLATVNVSSKNQFVTRCLGCLSAKLRDSG